MAKRPKATSPSIVEDARELLDNAQDIIDKKPTSTPLQPNPAPAYFTEAVELQRRGSSDEDEFTFLDDDARRIKRLSKKPDIDHLPDGVAHVNGEDIPLFAPGDRIVAERHTELLPGIPWLDTRTYIVQDIDDETGFVRCLDEEQGHRAYVGFKHPFTRIKLAVNGVNPFRKAKKIRVTAEGETTNATGEKPRGRQKGTKNRPKEVVAAEKKAKAELRELKAKKRLQKARGKKGSRR